MNYNIAIVEDEAKEAQTLRSYFSRLSTSSDDSFQVRWFKTGGEFLSSYQPVYDLVLMDINLPDLSGMDVAGYLRKLDQSVVLMFVTSMAQYAVKGYEVDALDFLVKPVSYTTFALKLKRALAKCASKQNRELLISVSDGVYRTSASRIKYVEISSHSLVYHTTDGMLNAYGSLKQLEETLDPRQFVRCNRCYLVNLAYVRAVQGSMVSVDGELLQISRPKRTAFLEALTNYLGGGI